MEQKFDDPFKAKPQGTYAEEWAEKKKLAREKAYEMADNASHDVFEGNNNLTKYLDVLSRMERMSLMNTLLVFAQKPEAIRVGTFNEWRDRGRSIKTGEVSFIQMVPGKERFRTDGSTGRYRDVVHAFDVTQTKGAPLPSYSSKLDIRDKLRALISAAPVAYVQVEPGAIAAQALYDPGRKEVLIQKGLDGDTIFRSLALEFSHARLDTGRYSREACGFHAACAAYIICKRYDIEPGAIPEVPEHFMDMDADEKRSEIVGIRQCANQTMERMNKSVEYNRSKNNEQER